MEPIQPTSQPLAATQIVKGAEQAIQKESETSLQDPVEAARELVTWTMELLTTLAIPLTAQTVLPPSVYPNPETRKEVAAFDKWVKQTQSHLGSLNLGLRGCSLIFWSQLIGAKREVLANARKELAKLSTDDSQVQDALKKITDAEGAVGKEEQAYLEQKRSWGLRAFRQSLRITQPYLKELGRAASLTAIAKVTNLAFQWTISSLGLLFSGQAFKKSLSDWKIYKQGTADFEMRLRLPKPIENPNEAWEKMRARDLKDRFLGILKNDPEIMQRIRSTHQTQPDVEWKQFFQQKYEFPEDQANLLENFMISLPETLDFRQFDLSLHKTNLQNLSLILAMLTRAQLEGDVSQILREWKKNIPNILNAMESQRGWAALETDWEKVQFFQKHYGCSKKEAEEIKNFFSSQIGSDLRAKELHLILHKPSDHLKSALAKLHLGHQRDQQEMRMHAVKNGLLEMVSAKQKMEGAFLKLKLGETGSIFTISSLQFAAQLALLVLGLATIPFGGAGVILFWLAVASFAATGALTLGSTYYTARKRYHRSVEEFQFVNARLFYADLRKKIAQHRLARYSLSGPTANDPTLIKMQKNIKKWDNTAQALQERLSKAAWKDFAEQHLYQWQKWGKPEEVVLDDLSQALQASDPKQLDQESNRLLREYFGMTKENFSSDSAHLQKQLRHFFTFDHSALVKFMKNQIARGATKMKRGKHGKENAQPATA